MTGPKPPKNVRAVMADGREIPLDCAFEGVQGGINVWRAVWTLPEPPDQVLMDVLPAHSSVSISVETNVEQERERT